MNSGPRPSTRDFATSRATRSFIAMLPQAGNSWALNEAAHLLNRAGFGGSPAEIKALHALGRERAVDSLLTASDASDAFPLPEWASIERAVADMRERIEQKRQMEKTSSTMSAEEAEKARREAFGNFQKENRQHALEGQGWWFRRMLMTRAPLREKMTLFWHDHFATSVQKVKLPALMIQQNELFREQALGSFQKLTQSVLLDPAMLVYLDTGSSRKGHPNENFAREVMELFTLGEGNYTEEDIHEAARAFTGYQIDRRNGKVVHMKWQWDETTKKIFGKTGAFNGEDVIGMIFEKPQASLFMTRKLWEYFVSENPPDAALEPLAESFRKSGYQIAPLLREIFLSKEFYSESSIRSQIKCPVQYLVGLLKQFEIKSPPVGFPIIGQQQLGQVLFMPPNVAGWDWGQAWINTSTLLSRYNLAGFIARGSDEMGNSMTMEQTKIPGMAPAPKHAGLGWKGPDYEKIAPRPLRENPVELVDDLIFRFFQGPLPDKARDSFIAYANDKKGVIFTNKETGELCHLMLSTPYYQLC